MSSYEFLERVEVYIEGTWKPAEYVNELTTGEWPHRVRVIEPDGGRWSLLAHDGSVRRPA